MTDAQFDAILAELVAGKPVRKALEAHSVNPNVFYPALDADAEKAKRYARAMDAGYDAFADGTVEIADDPSIEPNDKRIRVDVRKWLLAKRARRKYGEQVTLSNDPDNPIPPLLVVGGPLAKPGSDGGQSTD